MQQVAERGKFGRIALVALGANQKAEQGTLRETMTEALNTLSQVFGPVTQSPLYQTPCFPAGAGPDYLNAACAFETAKSATDVLQILHGIEADFGRERMQRWGQRTLDLDLIALGDAVLPDKQTQTRWRTLGLEAQKTSAPDQLILPHPRLQDRAFVLVPLAAIAPDWVHPLLGKSVGEMLADCPAQDLAEITPI